MTSWLNGRPYSQQYEWLRDIIAGEDTIAPWDPDVELDVLCDEIWDLAQSNPATPSPYKSGRPRLTPRRRAAITILDRIQAFIRRHFGDTAQ